jgi:hypothetical protein
MNQFGLGDHTAMFGPRLLETSKVGVIRVDTLDGCSLQVRVTSTRSVGVFPSLAINRGPERPAAPKQSVRQLRNEAGGGDAILGRKGVP